MSLGYGLEVLEEAGLTGQPVLSAFLLQEIVHMLGLVECDVPILDIDRL